MKQYEDWITEYLKSKGGRVKNACQDAVLRMCQAFPELTAVRGFVFPEPYEGDIEEACPTVDMELPDRRLAYSSEFGLEQHWWCITPSGKIVDPTRIQYSWEGIQYVPLDPAKHGPVPTGKCLDCGELLFSGLTLKEFCDELCKSRTEKYMAEEMAKIEATK